ncbi:MAG: hypothetical protein WBG46_00060 [Nonlabens sp.]
MKYVFYILLALSVLSIAFNFTQLNFNAPFQGDSQIAAISIVAGLCVSVLMGIMLISLKIKERQQTTD